MPATRTQIYLTPEQRKQLDALGERQRKSLAELIRAAVDVYLETEGSTPTDALRSTFGTMPELEVPSRDEWDRG